MGWLRKLFGGGDRDRDDVHGPGEYARVGEEHRADKQQADPGALEVEGDPRGGLQDEQYRTADPRDVVEAEGVAMSGPGGAPMEDLTPEERRERQGGSSGPGP